MSEQKITVAQRVAQALKRHGVEYLFGQSNPASVTLACDDIGITQIGYRQENAGTYMADAYARTSGKVPVVTAQNGPAATLLVAGLAECLTASVPVVALVQDVALGQMDKNAFQELDQIALFQGVSKWLKRLPSVDRVEDYIDMAFTAAASGRPGPAVLLLPMDLLPQKVEYRSEQRTLSLGISPLDRCAADPEQVSKAASLLAGAQRPFIYAGGGVISSGAQSQLRQLQELASLPVATSTMGKGAVDETHELSMGVIGYYMDRRGMARHVREEISNADVILLVGNRTNQNGTDSWTLLPEGAIYIHIDVDPSEIGRNYESHRLVGDARLVLQQLLDAMSGQGLSHRAGLRSERTAAIARSKQLHLEEVEEVCTSDQVPLRPERFMRELEGRLSDDHIVVADASFSSIWIANYLAAVEQRKFITPRGQAGLGWGFPMAMGARLAAPQREVFCVVGDGGFAHVWSELETARRHDIKVVVAVMNNQILGYQKHAEDAKVGRHTNVCDFQPVDHAAIAEACGLTGIRVEEAGDIGPAIERAMASDASVVIDVICDPDAMPPVSVFSSLETY